MIEVTATTDKDGKPRTELLVEGNSQEVLIELIAINCGVIQELLPYIRDGLSLKTFARGIADEAARALEEAIRGEART